MLACRRPLQICSRVNWLMDNVSHPVAAGQRLYSTRYTLLQRWPAILAVSFSLCHFSTGKSRTTVSPHKKIYWQKYSRFTDSFDFSAYFCIASYWRWTKRCMGVWGWLFIHAFIYRDAAGVIQNSVGSEVNRVQVLPMWLYSSKMRAQKSAGFGLRFVVSWNPYRCALIVYVC